MTRDEFIMSFTNESKILLMNQLLGEVYDRVRNGKRDAIVVISEHLGEFVEKSASDPRLADAFIEDEQMRMWREVNMHNCERQNEMLNKLLFQLGDKL